MPRAAESLEERLAACRREVQELTAETLNLYRQVNLLYRIGDAIAESAEVEAICRLVLRECVRIVRARAGVVELEQGGRWGEAPPAPRDVLSVPIETRNGRLGTITVYDKRQGFFTAADEKLMRAVARQAGVAIDNNRLVQGLIQKNEELEALDRMKSEFVSNVSHELRTPLTSIKGFAATILQDEEMPREVLREFVGIINDESDKLVAIVDDILDLSKMMAGHMRYDMQRRPVESIVREVVRLLGVLAEKKGLTLECEIVDPAVARLDANRFAQVLKNLIGNAIKFTDRGGVRVRQWVEGGEVHVAVADTGEGIPPDQLSRIFEKFYRVENVVHTREGTGLGLALARMILDAHGARLTVESEPGRGSVFTVHVPVATGEDGCPSAC